MSTTTQPNPIATIAHAYREIDPPTTEYIVMIRSAPLRGSTSAGKYRRPVRIAVIEIDRARLRPGDSEPRMISTHARGVVRIVETWENVDSRYDGPRSAYGQALRSARAMAERLTASGEIRHG